jgi:hypothetical protein
LTTSKQRLILPLSSLPPKPKVPTSTAKLEELLERDITPPQNDVADSLLDIAESLLAKYQDLETNYQGLKATAAQNRTVPLIADIVYKASKHLRKYISDNTVTHLNTTNFIRAWETAGGISDNTTPQADLIKMFIINNASQYNANNPQYLQYEFEKYKAWLCMYAERCNLAHSGYDDMSSQKLWEALKKIEADVKSGKAIFSNQTWPRFALAAIENMREFKFMISGGIIRAKKDNSVIIP